MTHELLSWRMDDAKASSPLGSNGGEDAHSDEDYNGRAFLWELDPRRTRRSSEVDDDQTSSDGEGHGLMDAFENFNLQAERRVKELLEATDAKLFADESDLSDPLDAPPPNTPSYILMSDQYRLSRPTQFHHWRQCFPYLQVTGKSAFSEVPDEHIQLRAGPPLSVFSPKPIPWEMTIVGNALRLEIDTSDPPQEELILADGEMEEVVKEDRPALTEPQLEENDAHSVDSENDKRPLTGSLTCTSPRTSKAEQAVDQLTLEWYSEILPPLCTSVFEKLLRKQQLNLRIARENHEHEVRVAYEKATAAKEEELCRLEQEEQERLRYEAAVAKAQEEARIREEDHRQEMLRQQLEENDEDEIKIRTLAYSHLREWYQPQKKCFSHRGRQLTYLNPVLKLRDRNDPGDAESIFVEGEDQTTTIKPPPTVLLPKKPSSSRKPTRSRRVSSPSEADLCNATSPAVSPRTSPSTARSQSLSAGRDGIQLPRIDKSTVTCKTTRPAKPSRRKSSKDDRLLPTSTPRTSATTAAPSRVYSSSPYRIPPVILRVELKRDGAATARRPNHRTAQHDENVEDVTPR